MQSHCTVHTRRTTRSPPRWECTPIDTITNIAGFCVNSTTCSDNQCLKIYKKRQIHLKNANGSPVFSTYSSLICKVVFQVNSD